LETTIVMSSFCMASWAIFYHASVSVEFMILPLLLLVAFRLGLSGSVIAVNLLALVALFATLSAQGPFHLRSDMKEQYSIMLLRIFLIVSMMMCLPVSLVLLERKRFEQRLSDAYAQLNLIAISDALTGIANRRCFDQTIDREWRRAIRDCSELSLLMIDVDEFKQYNDTKGHVEGDECLRRVAAAIVSVPGRTTDLVARYGGEEFVVVIPRTNLGGAQRMANLIRIAVESIELSHPGSKHGRVTVSIGCSVGRPTIGIGPNSLIAAADRALYKAKQLGRNCVVPYSIVNSPPVELP
jgi:diguanylate cyclase (GGDEF)-like protein